MRLPGAGSVLLAKLPTGGERNATIKSRGAFLGADGSQRGAVQDVAHGHGGRFSGSAAIRCFSVSHVKHAEQHSRYTPNPATIFFRNGVAFVRGRGRGEQRQGMAEFGRCCDSRRETGPEVGPGRSRRGYSWARCRGGCREVRNLPGPGARNPRAAVLGPVSVEDPEETGRSVFGQGSGEASRETRPKVSLARIGC